MSTARKPLVWLGEEIESPPLASEGKVEAFLLLERLQKGEKLKLPHSRPLPKVGKGFHELRVRDERGNWRIVYRADSDAVVILDVFKKTSGAEQKKSFERCEQRAKRYDREQKARKGDKKG